MTPLWLLHTQTARDLIGGRTPLSSKLRQHLLALEHPRLAISALTQAQLRQDVLNLPKASQPGMTVLLDEFFRWVETLPWDSQSAQCYAQLTALADKSTTKENAPAGDVLGAIDIMIAAQACTAKLPLVSSDVRFDIFSPELVREDWCD